MKRIMRLGVGILALVAIAPAAEAGHGCGCGPSWSIGVGFGPSIGYYRPWYPAPYPYYYRPYPVYVAPAPVIVQPAPVIQQVPVSQPVYQAPAPTPITTQSAPAEGVQADIDYHLRMLTTPDERARGDSVLQLGKLKARRAIDPLAATLSGDQSPVVRETAARALGLIGSSQALPALQHAAQADSDRDVRRSAQFAIEVIQSRN